MHSWSGRTLRARSSRGCGAASPASTSCLFLASASRGQHHTGSLSCPMSLQPADVLLIHSVRTQPRDSEGRPRRVGREAQLDGHFYLSDIRDHTQSGCTTRRFRTKSAAGLFAMVGGGGGSGAQWLPCVPNGKWVFPLVFTLSPRCGGTSWWSVASSEGPEMHFGTRLGKNR